MTSARGTEAATFWNWGAQLPTSALASGKDYLSSCLHGLTCEQTSFGLRDPILQNPRSQVISYFVYLASACSQKGEANVELKDPISPIGFNRI